MKQLKAPFPYWGGKSTWAPTIWERFGDDAYTYIEPFAGSLAVLLGNPHPARREIVCDTHSGIANFFRAVRSDPEKVAHYATWPTIHQDLRARHLWLIDYFTANDHKFMEDPDYYDCKAAGWWVWGQSNWIGGQFCDYESSKPSDTIPHVKGDGSGQGVTAQRTPDDCIPYVNTGASGRGVTAQRAAALKNPNDLIPFVHNGGSGQGVTAQRKPSDSIPYERGDGAGRGVSAMRKSDLSENFGVQENHFNFVLGMLQALSDRLFKVIVLNRSWESALTRSMIGIKHLDRVCIFLDPPYVSEGRHKLYSSDRAGSTDDVAINSYKWAVEHGAQFKIAYASHAGDFELPPNWTKEVRKFNTHRIVNDDRPRDQIMFSPACNKPIEGHWLF